MDRDIAEPAFGCAFNNGAEGGAAFLAIWRQQAQPFAMIDRPIEQKKPSRERLSAALRENLRRRKAQAKGRKEGREEVRKEGRSAAASAPERDGKPHDSAGIIEKK
jgi:hypothetical protein